MTSERGIFLDTNGREAENGKTEYLTARNSRFQRGAIQWGTRKFTF